MNRISTATAFLVSASMLGSLPSAVAQSIDTPMTRLRPIGSPSAVDQYRTVGSVDHRETGYAVRPSSTPVYNGENVRQAQFEVPTLPPDSNTFSPPSTGSPMGLPNNFSTPGPITSAPVPAAPPRGLPVNPNVPPVAVPNTPGRTITPLSPSSSSDMAPMIQPQLGGSFATIDNCNCISAASGYSAASGFGAGGCGAPVTYQAPPAYVAPQVQIPAPAILPGGFAAPATSAAPAGALMTFGQEINPVQVGQGLLGQPKAYVPGQPIRNWLRYFTP